jgi:prefoldin subunit 5
MQEQELSAEEMLASVKEESAPATAAATPETAQTPQQSPFDPSKLEYEVNGKKIIEPWEMVQKRAQMGYHYAQQMEALKREREGFDQERSKYQTYEQQVKELGRWKEYDEFARSNPEWARHVEEAWNNRQNLGQSTQGLQDPRFEALQKEIAELRGLKDEFATEKQKIQYAAEDKQFDSEIGSVAKKFGVDFQISDEQGASLEWRVLEHMKKMGMDGSIPGQFEAAFKDYHFDNLVGKQKEAAQAKPRLAQKRYTWGLPNTVRKYSGSGF